MSAPFIKAMASDSKFGATDKVTHKRLYLGDFELRTPEILID